MSSSAHPGINLGGGDPKAQRESETPAFGFWVFLMSDLIIFGVLFAHYVVMTGARAGGPGPSTLFDLRSVAAQTFLLLASSFTYGMASLALKHQRQVRPVAIWLIVTAALGAAFVLLELRDFVNMVGEGGPPQRSGFLSALWALTGLHWLHVTAGLVWIATMLALLSRFGLSDRNKTRLLLLGLYWHFLDLIWIGILSVVYLGGLA
ncbi:cytochrome o ubiquinol oxidase subunit 3 [Hasllibacter halocynthiae]|uniref:Cytochrome bo(3) ubiquinol oxidase subunit 3 n=1 Tax=Hasllibacter halocynthiae TaxID=595589 RepID=A0A2T0X4C8_9RHOB|nr:cytochrome c oxidase subunit 3 [Hasllibacter halocynthiae]PRY93800.1 cytochrome o ubiquinol oxidase subunit 3 [Hasllibacter halocynthiae]